MDISKTLARLRKKCRLTQSDVADYLNAHAKKDLTFKAVSHWEVGFSSPSVEHFLLLCELYQVDDIQFTFRGNGAKWSERLNDIGKRKVEEYAALLVGNPQFRIQKEASHETGVIKLYDMPASAGTGSLLDSDAYEELEVDDTVPSGVDYAVRITGDSMLPRFIDRQVVFVKEQSTLDTGEIGVFVLNEESYCKKLGHGELLSLNTRYKPIPIHEYDSLYVLGKVVG